MSELDTFSTWFENPFYVQNIPSSYIYEVGPSYIKQKKLSSMSSFSESFHKEEENPLNKLNSLVREFLFKNENLLNYFNSLWLCDFDIMDPYSIKNFLNNNYYLEDHYIKSLQNFFIWIKSIFSSLRKYFPNQCNYYEEIVSLIWDKKYNLSKYSDEVDNILFSFNEKRFKKLSGNYFIELKKYEYENNITGVVDILKKSLVLFNSFDTTFNIDEEFIDEIKLEIKDLINESLNFLIRVNNNSEFSLNKWFNYLNINFSSIIWNLELGWDFLILEKVRFLEIFLNTWNITEKIDKINKIISLYKELLSNSELIINFSTEDTYEYSSNLDNYEERLIYLESIKENVLELTEKAEELLYCLEYNIFLNDLDTFIKLIDIILTKIKLYEEFFRDFICKFNEYRNYYKKLKLELWNEDKKNFSHNTSFSIPQAEKLLWLSWEYTKKDVKGRYKKLAMKYHPDRDGWDKTEFQKLTNARDLLLK